MKAVGVLWHVHLIFLHIEAGFAGPLQAQGSVTSKINYFFCIFLQNSMADINLDEFRLKFHYKLLHVLWLCHAKLRAVKQIRFCSIFLGSTFRTPGIYRRTSRQVPFFQMKAERRRREAGCEQSKTSSGHVCIYVCMCAYMYVCLSSISRD